MSVQYALLMLQRKNSGISSPDSAMLKAGSKHKSPLKLRRLSKIVWGRLFSRLSFFSRRAFQMRVKM